ncbi:hypothetical protein NUSPORA_00974 [Nucleospora cyclopteri]
MKIYNTVFILLPHIILGLFFRDPRTGLFLTIKFDKIVLGHYPVNFELKNASGKRTKNLISEGKVLTNHFWVPRMKEKRTWFKMTQNLEITVSGVDTVNIMRGPYCLVKSGNDLSFKWCYANDGLDLYMCKTPDCMEKQMFQSDMYGDNYGSIGSYNDHGRNYGMNFNGMGMSNMGYPDMEYPDMGMSNMGSPYMGMSNMGSPYMGSPHMGYSSMYLPRRRSPRRYRPGLGFSSMPPFGTNYRRPYYNRRSRRNYGRYFNDSDSYMCNRRYLKDNCSSSSSSSSSDYY